VQANYLRALAPDLAAATGGMDAVIALGIVIEGLTEDQRVARDSFAKRFAPFASAPTRALVRATFKAPA
jgi:6,7-dimethyl-8-ribityllumazine synthase